MGVAQMEHHHGRKTPRRAALAAWIGSVMEYYDFFIYGTAAALVFGKIFFPGSAPAAGTLLALATFGAGYIARPIGAFLLGHVGDKFGRKRVLVLTLLLMGASTFLIGCLPTYEHIGIIAPILLVVARLTQGLSASGEQAAANAMTFEHAPTNRRSFFTSFSQSGTMTGLILATAVFLPISKLPEADLLSWGWRVPFWVSALVVLTGYFIRRSLEETPVFLEEQDRGEVPHMPLAVLLQNSSGDVFRVVLCALVSTVSTMFGVFALSYAVNTMHVDRGTMLWVTVCANIVALIAIPLWAILSDRIGRKPVFIFGAVAPAVLMFPYLWSIGSHNVPMIFVFGVLMAGIAYSASNAIWPVMYAEMFHTKVRLSGMAIGTQIGFALGGFAPSIAAALQSGSNSWLPAAWLTAGTCLIAAVAAFTGRETFKVDLEELGRREQVPSVPTVNRSA